MSAVNELSNFKGKRQTSKDVPTSDSNSIMRSKTMLIDCLIRLFCLIAG
jgi:hypothetical protein